MRIELLINILFCTLDREKGIISYLIKIQKGKVCCIERKKPQSKVFEWSVPLLQISLIHFTCSSNIPGSIKSLVFQFDELSSQCRRDSCKIKLYDVHVWLCSLEKNTKGQRRALSVWNISHSKLSYFKRKWMRFTKERRASLSLPYTSRPPLWPVCWIHWMSSMELSLFKSGIDRNSCL